MPSIDVPAARSWYPKPDLDELFGVGHRGVDKGQTIGRQVAVGLVRAGVGEAAQVDERGLVMLASSQRKNLRIRRKLCI